jgi:tRNA(Ile)-lysidine synthase
MHRDADKRTGLAISGGVDSMALATLCSGLRESSQHGKHLSFTAFIVDHGLRSGSHDEALEVAEFLDQLSMPSKILTLDPKHYGDAHASRRVESIARRLRYRAMGQACRAQGITELLFAHHADDQAETTLMRLANNYLGKGLAGMQYEARIPECEGVYGVHESGSPGIICCENLAMRHGVDGAGMDVEGGGVTILRPLLSYTKDRLVATCEQAGTKWVEDETNSDLSLTLRNTVRQLHEKNVLPKALQRPNLCSIAARTSERTAQQEERAHKIFRSLDIKLDPSSGHAICKINLQTADEIHKAPDVDHIKAIILRKLLLLVAPTSNVDLSTLEAASATFLEPQPHKSHPVPIVIAGAAAVRLKDTKGAVVYELRRTPPPKRAKETRAEVSISLKSQPSTNEVSWSDWTLWDERYWIRIGAETRRHAKAMDAIVRMFTPDDVAVLRRDPQTDKTDLHARLASVKGHLRATLPVIVSGDSGGEQHIVALPSLGWSRVGWALKDEIKQGVHDAKYFYDIRYKRIDDSLTRPIGI